MFVITFCSLLMLNVFTCFPIMDELVDFCGPLDKHLQDVRLSCIINSYMKKYSFSNIKIQPKTINHNGCRRSTPMANFEPLKVTVFIQ